MSEDDIDMLGPDGASAARVDRDRRAPRFSWTPAYEATFFRSLCESVQLGLRENSSFKAEAWERAAVALQESHGAFPAKSHLINKSDNARKRFRLWRGLREDSEFLYNPLTKTVTATEDAWKLHIEREPLSRALRGRPFDHEEYMEVLYPDVIGSGGAPKRIMKPRRRTDGQLGDDSDMPGTGILNLQGDAGSDSPQQQQHQSQTASLLDSPSEQRPSLSQTPSGSSAGSLVPQRPMTTTIPPRSAIAQPSALTPPDEMISSTKKRVLSNAPPSAFDASPPSADIINTPSTAPPQPPSPEKRRRTTSTATDTVSAIPTILNSSAGHSRTTHASTASAFSPADAQASSSRTALHDLADALNAHKRPQWQEQALELFFREFSDEEMNLQIKISETVLTDESRALVFCKMPPRLRQHWVGQFREGHRRT